MGRGAGLGWHAMRCMAPGLTSFVPAPLDAAAIYARDGEAGWAGGRKCIVEYSVSVQLEAKDGRKPCSRD